MRKTRSGFTLIEAILAIVLVAVLIGGAILWNRVTVINKWAVNHQTWVTGELYPWIKNSSFAKGTGTGDPDGDKPPPPPGGLE